jgi:hypothetical protein
VVYIPMADQWVLEAMNEDKANKYLMKEFFKQNADIIAGDSRLSPFFEDQLNDQPIRDEAYVEFSKAIGENSVPNCGMIVDEAQKLTQAAAAKTVIGRDGFPAVIDGKTFFAKDFTIWTGFSGNFCSQLCASSHGLREFKLPSGEEHRLRFVAPFSIQTGRTLLRHEDSPFLVKADADVSDEVLTNTMEHITEWMPRPMRNAAIICKLKGTAVGLKEFKIVHFDNLLIYCQ